MLCFVSLGFVLIYLAPLLVLLIVVLTMDFAPDPSLDCRYHPLPNTTTRTHTHTHTHTQRHSTHRFWQLSASQNLSPIKGSTVVLVDVATNNLTPMSDKSQVQVAQVGALLALMFKSCCEFCTVIAFDSVSGGHETVTDIDSNDMLASVNRIAHMGPLPRPHGGAPGGLLQNLYGQILAGEQRVDSIVLLRGVLNIDTHPLDWFTNRYRKLVRADFMRVEVCDFDS